MDQAKTRNALLIALLVSAACGPSEDPADQTDDVGVESDGGGDPQNSEDGGGDTLNSEDGDDMGGMDEPDTGGSAAWICGSAATLAVVDEIVRDLVADASWSFAHSSEFGRAYALGLPATDGASIGEATAFMPCSEAAEFDPYCEPEIDTGLSKCLRIGCESATVAFAEVYFTDGSTQSPDDAMAITYEGRDGEVVEWAERPKRRWTNDLGAAGKDVAATLAADFTITSPDGEIHVVYEGTARTVETADGPQTELSVEFSRLGELDSASVQVTHGDTSFEGLFSGGGAEFPILETGIDSSDCP